MAWASLSTRLANLPTVLAGPILRAVTPTSVTVWFALKEQATVTLSVYTSDSLTGVPLLSGSAPATKIGPNLYIVAVTATPTSPSTQLAFGTIYFYGVSFATASGGPYNLVQATRSTSAAAFAYPPYQAPSFLLPPSDLQQVRISVGSCRKMHTESPDALPLLDDVLAAAASTPVQRPQLLLMGGDQIYADETTPTLLAMLTDAGTVLLGPEDLPIDSTTSSSPTAYPPLSRTKLIKAAGFTTDVSDSHLLGLGEYLAMYLFAWSDVLWPAPTTVPPSSVPTADDVFAGKLFGAGDLGPELPNDSPNIKRYKESVAEQQQIVALLSTLPKVRRALANIATYMILDDHEITDDFNMQKRFCDAVYASPLGTRVVQNGLIAYALCQHWGNCPEQFTGTAAGAVLLQLFANAKNGYADIAVDSQSKATLLEIVGLHDPTQLAAQQPYYCVYHDPQSLTYNYTIEGAAFQLIVTDTRTWREFPRQGGLAPANLLSEAQIKAQITNTPALGTYAGQPADRLLIVVVTTNMPPCPAIRQAGRDLPSVPGHKFDSEDFYDSWQIEQIDFARMVVAIGKKLPASPAPFSESVVLLSGDVHSSQATRMLYWANQQVGDAVGAATAKTVVFAQLVASALHNESTATVGEHYAGYDYKDPSVAASLGKQPVYRTEVFVGWNPNTVPDKTVVGNYTLTAGDQSPYDPPPQPGPLYFDADRPTVTTREEIMGTFFDSSAPNFTTSPHYWYRMDYLHSTASDVTFQAPTLNAPATLEPEILRALTYKQAFGKGGDEQVGFSNLGEVTFIKGTSVPTWTAQLMVRWGPSQLVGWVQFEVSLDPNDLVTYPKKTSTP